MPQLRTSIEPIADVSSRHERSMPRFLLDLRVRIPLLELS